MKATKNLSKAQSHRRVRREPTHEEISAMAIALWQQRGCVEGCDLEIWLDAEAGCRAVLIRLAHGIPGAVPLFDEQLNSNHPVDRLLDGLVAPAAQRSPTSL